MKLMGMSEAVYWCAVFVKAMLFLLLASVFYLLCLFVSVGENGRVFNASDPSLVLVFFIIYDVSLITFCIMVSTFFNKGKLCSFGIETLWRGWSWKKAMEVIHMWQRTCMSILIIYSHLLCNQQQLFVVWTFLEMGILNVHTNQLQIKLFMLPHLMMFLANTASYAGGLLYFGFFFPWFFINSEYETMTQGQKFASCLPFNTAMAMGFNIIGIHEGTGWSFHNIVHILYLTICLYVKSAVNLVKMFRFFKNPTYLAEYFRRGSAVEQLPQSALCRR